MKTKIKQLMTYIGVLMAMTALYTLTLPIRTVTFEDRTYEMIIKGYNMPEFSPWGGIVVLAPLVLLGLMLSKLPDRHKTMGLLGLLMLSSTALYNSASAIYQYTTQGTVCYAEPHAGHLLYGFVLFWAFLCFWVSLNVFDRTKT